MARPVIFTALDFSSKVVSQTFFGMAVESASSIRTGPVRCLRRSPRIASLAWTSFFRALILSTSPITFSSSAMRVWVVAIRWAFFFSSDASPSYQIQFPSRVMNRAPPTTTRNCRPTSRFFSCRTGRRLMWIIIAASSSRELVPGPAQGQPDGDGRHRRDIHDEARIEATAVDDDVLERVRDLHRHAHPRLDGLEERGDLRRASRKEELGELRVGGGAGVEVERALDLARDLLGHAGHDPLDLLWHHRVGLAAPTADLQRLGLLVGDVE